MSHYTTRKAVPIGSLSGDLKTVAALCRQRMRTRGGAVAEWLMWVDDNGEIYFSDSKGAYAAHVLETRLDQMICVYRGAGVTAKDILEDLQDAAERAGKTLGDVVSRYCAERAA